MGLTTLTNLKTWVGSTTSDDDVLLTRLIDQISGAILNYIQRPALTRTTYDELINGVGNRRIMLRNWPVISISSLTVNGQAIPPASSFGQAGYTLQTWDGTPPGNPQSISLCGYTFPRGYDNIAVVYDAGYAIEDDDYTIPPALQITVSPTLGIWAQDDGITYANGTALTSVSGNPSAGQYTVTPDSTGSAVYGFASADNGSDILINYSFTPFPLEQACIEWCAERYRYKDRIGQQSKSLGGNETASYRIGVIPDFVKGVLDQYAKFLPL